MPAISTLLFDLGNTLIYFDGDWQEVMQRAVNALYLTLRARNLELPSEKFQKTFWELLNSYYVQRELELTETTTTKLLADHLASFGFAELRTEWIRSAIASLYAVTQQHWHPEDDAIMILEQLAKRGYRMALLSNAADDQDVQTLVDKAGIRPYFEQILSSAAAGIRKPDPEIFHRVLRQMGTTPSAAAMIGDTLNADILGAQRTGIVDIWISRRVDVANNHRDPEQIQPSYEIKSLTELPHLLDIIQRS